MRIYLYIIDGNSSFNNARGSSHRQAINRSNIKMNHYSNTNQEHGSVPDDVVVDTFDNEEDVVNDSRLSSKEVIIESCTGGLVYKVSDKPPAHLLVMFALQQGLLSLANQLALAYMVADAACGGNNDELRTRLVSSTLFMNGVATFLVVFLGVRLPLFQGASYEYAVPLLALKNFDPLYCEKAVSSEALQYNNVVGNMTTVASDMAAASDEVTSRLLQSWMGSLMLVGGIHFIVGATGITGFLLRFIGPVTIVPTILLIGIFLVKAAIKFASIHWGISLLTFGCAVIFSFYLAKRNTPIPMWTRKKGFHIIYYPLHQVYAILFAMIIGWILSAILTASGALTNDVNDPGYLARSDARVDIVYTASWFYFPYPGQFGPPSFSVNAFIGFMIATVISILDSIGDYYACARTSHVPPPPANAVNRGLLLEGFCSFLAGTLGCAHATTTNGGNIGAVGLTRVACRNVFVAVGVMYVCFALFGKLCAIFVTIPYPVLGGALITMFGVFNGVVLSNLQGISLGSTRNMGIIGISLFVGLMVPHYIGENPNVIQTGNEDADKILTMVLGNANFAGAVLSCFLDNTVPGTREERGMHMFLIDESKIDSSTIGTEFEEGREIYRLPYFHDRIASSCLGRILPFLPKQTVEKHEDTEAK